MAYIVNQDIIDRVGTTAATQLTSDSGGTPDSGVLDEVRLSSEGEVNGYLSKRYAVPVDLTAHADLAATLKGFTLDVAEYRLRSRRDSMAEVHEKMYANAKEWLEKVRKGEIPLPAALTPVSTTADKPLQGYGNYRDSAGPGAMN